MLISHQFALILKSSAEFTISAPSALDNVRIKRRINLKGSAEIKTYDPL